MKFRPSFSNVISVVALLVALSGTAAAATMASQPVNNSDLHFGGHDSSTKVVVTPTDSKPVTIDSLHFTAPRRSSAFVDSGFTVTNNSPESVTISVIVGMTGMAEKYTIDQTVPAGATEQVAGVLNCNGIPAGKHIMTFSALAPNLGEGNVTFGFRTENITVYNPKKLAYPEPQDHPA